jgi:[ribosomal protein S5]-alanine N-acetyltransferase
MQKTQIHNSGLKTYRGPGERHMIFQPIETNRLLLREFELEDEKDIHQYASNPNVVRYLPWGPNNIQDTSEFLIRSLKFQDDIPRYHYEIAVVNKQSNCLIGACGIHVDKPADDEGWIGYCYDEIAWGHGYATEAAKAIIHFGFTQLNLHRIFATCDSLNIGSSRVLEKSGMVREGRLREHKLQKGKYRDSFIYSILENEYNHKL